MSHRLLVLLSAPVLLSGCIHAPITAAAEVFLLDYEIVDLDPNDDIDTADPGHHCSSAQRNGDTVTVWLWPDEERTEGPWLAVFPRIPDDWRSGIGGEPYKTTFPREIPINVPDDPATLGVLEWEARGGNGTMRLDGKAIGLPHEWSVTGNGGAWRADATLSAWRGEVMVDRYQGFCD